VALWERNPDFGWEQASAAPANVLDWRERVSAFEDVAAYQEGVAGITWLDAGEPRRVGLTRVTGNFFDVLGVRPALGRLPTWEDTWADGEESVVASHAFWRESLGGDPGVVGRTLELAGGPFRVVAILPPGFDFPSAGAQLWSPYGWEPGARQEAWFRRAHFVRPVARLRDGVTPEQARAELDAVALQLQEEHPALNKNMYAGLTPVRGWLVGSRERPLRALSAGVLVLLLLACANVGTLFLVRAGARSGELAVRRALGAGQRRILRQLLSEALLIGAGAGALGLGLAWLGIQGIASLRPVRIGGGPAMSLEGPVLAFALAASVGTVLLFAGGPALSASRHGIAGVLRGSGRSSVQRRRPVGQRLIPVQVALAVVLVLAAGLVSRSFGRLRAVDPGVDARGVHLFGLSLPEAPYEGPDAVLAFWDGLLEGIEALPGVERAAVTSGVPLTFSGWTSQVVGRSWEPGEIAFEVRHRSSSPGYFEVMGVPILRGRGFRPGDGRDGVPVAVVNRTFAETWFPDRDPLGEEITFDREPDENSVWRTIVGVVGDEHQGSLALPPDPEIWEPLGQDLFRPGLVVVRSAGVPEGLDAALREVVGSLDPRLPLIGLRPFQEVVDDAAGDARFLLLLFNSFGGLAFVLAIVGVYGVTAQTVRRRVPEFGVRMALGADARLVSRLVLGRVLPLGKVGFRRALLRLGGRLPGVFGRKVEVYLIMSIPCRSCVPLPGVTH
jgi:predicted permease